MASNANTDGFKKMEATSANVALPSEQLPSISVMTVGARIEAASNNNRQQSPQQIQLGERGEQEQDGLLVMRQGDITSSYNGGGNNRNDDQNSKYMKLCIGIILLSCLIFVVVDTMNDKHIENSILDFLNWVEQHPYEGMLAVILVYIVATILFIPGSILTLGTGYAFGSASNNTAVGVALASISVFIGASLGSICSFLLGRYLFRDCVVHLASNYPIFRAVDRALQVNGLKIMILLRLSPLIPYNALDYMSGITAIPLWSYTVALIGIFPGTIMFCFVGASASSLAAANSDTNDDNKTIRIITIIFGVVFAIIGVSVASYYSKLELDRILAEEDIQEDGLNRSAASLPLRRNDTEENGGAALSEAFTTTTAATTVRGSKFDHAYSEDSN